MVLLDQKNNSVLNQTKDLMRSQLVSAMEKGEFDEKSAAGDFSACLFNQFASRLHRAARGQQIVHQKNLGPRAYAVNMDLKFCAAVFEIILQTVCAIRKLAWLPQRNERLFHQERQRSREQEPACLGRGHGVDLASAKMFTEQFDRLVESFR